MPRYQFNQESLLDVVTLIKSDAGGLRAYLHASNGSDESELSRVKHSLSQMDLQVVPVSYHGEAALEVRGIRDENTFLKQLQTSRLTDGSYTKKMPLPEDTKSLSGRLKKRTLQASGAFYLLGDAAYTTYGYKSAHWEDMLAGAFYFLGSSALLGYGNKDQSDLQIRDMSSKIYRQLLDYQKETGSHLETQNTSIENISAQNPKGVKAQVTEFIRRYPAETMNTFFGLAGLSIALGALKHKVFEPPTHYYTASEKKFEVLSSWLDVGLGTMTAASGAISTLVTEKAPDVDQPEKHDLFSRVMDWVQEKPLRVAGYGYMISTLCHAGSTAIDMRFANKYKHRDPSQGQKMKSIPYRAAFVGVNLVAEALMAMSSKGHGHGVKLDESMDGSVISIVADLIHKQQPKDRQGLTQYMAEFLAQPEVLNQEKDEIIAKLEKQLKILESHPWVSKVSQGQPSEKIPAKESILTVGPQQSHAKQFAASDAWEEKVSQTDSHSPTAQPFV